MARTMLAHSKNRFPSAASANLWPFALRLANKMHDNTLRPKDCVLPIELFSKVDVLPKLKNFHHFGCPAHALNDNQASGKKGPKWNLRGRLGVLLANFKAQCHKFADIAMGNLFLECANIIRASSCSVLM